MASHGKGVFWRDEEVETLLELIARSGKSERVMKSTHLPTKVIFHKLARQMSARGYPRTPEQCRSKFKRVKGDFYGALEAWQGIPRQSGKPPYFSNMMNLWDLAGRPSWQTRRHAAVLRGREATQRAAEGEQQEALDITPGNISTEDPLPPTADTPSGEQTGQEADEEGLPSTSGTPAPPARQRRKTLDDVLSAVEGLEQRLGSSINQLQERMTAVEGRVRRLGRRVTAVERRERQDARPTAS
ncbi:uncharacterized protein LOC129323588 [Eublepharis macularius]|uniref:Uncharacterized protein LOC129323588 n=1 Tax=Eublepharis macularius TaxID=481883 RepID=A0AA97IV07_EUBMA|nr:uncharacterized protein LOC129323588 [Eublepharis macularius]